MTPATKERTAREQRRLDSLHARLVKLQAEIERVEGQQNDRRDRRAVLMAEINALGLPRGVISSWTRENGMEGLSVSGVDNATRPYRSGDGRASANGRRST